MHLSPRLTRWLADRLIDGVACRRRPDFVIGGHDRPYIRRWWVIPRNPVLNLYLHQICRSDDDRALHDHPWANVSILLSGHYVEHRIAAGGVHRQADRYEGDIVFRRARHAHRLELLFGWSAPCWSLFITGPKLRDWGFHCRNRWVPWREFVAADDRGQIGVGCD